MTTPASVLRRILRRSTTKSYAGLVRAAADDRDTFRNVVGRRGRGAGLVGGLFGGAGLLAIAVAAGEPIETPKPPVAAGPAVDRFGDPLPPGAVARLGTLRYRSEGPITHPVVLSGGRQVLFASGMAIVLMDLDTGKTVHRVTRIRRPVNGAVGEPITALSVSADGRRMAVACRGLGADGNTPIAFWVGDVATGAVVREFPGRDRQVNALAFLAGGRQLAALDDQGVVSIWDSATGAKVREFTGPDRKLISLAVSPDGRTLATGTDVRLLTADILLWDAATGRLLDTLPAHAAPIKEVAFSPDGRIVVANGGERALLWEIATGREVRRFRGPGADRAESRHDFVAVAFSPDGRMLAAGTDPIRVWDAATGRSLDEFPLLAPSGVLAFRDAHTLIVGEADTLLLRDVAARRFTNDPGPRWHMEFVNFSRDGRMVVTADSDSTVRTWDATDGRPLSVKEWNPYTSCTLVSPGGQWVAFTENQGDATVTCIGDPTFGRIIRRLPDNGQHPVAISADGRRLATLRNLRPETPEGNPLTVWDVATGAQTGRPNVGAVSLPTVALSPDGRTVYAAEPDRPYRVRRWDVATGRVVREYALPKDVGAASLTMSAGGRRLAAVCRDGTIRVWDAVTGRACWQSADPTGRSRAFGNALSFSPDGSWLAVQSFEQAQVGVLDARFGTYAASLQGHGHEITCLAFSADSRRLASTSTDGTALLWDVEAAVGRLAVGLSDPARQAELWRDLAGDDAAGAHAVDCLQADPAVAVAALKSKMRPAVAVPADRVAPLLSALDDPAFVTREKAQRDLTALGSNAEPAVRAARATANAEVRRRIDSVLAAWEGEQRRGSRAVKVLESVATPEARELLRELAGGAAGARLTSEARASLERLK